MCLTNPAPSQLIGKGDQFIVLRPTSFSKDDYRGAPFPVTSVDLGAASQHNADLCTERCICFAITALGLCYRHQAPSHHVHNPQDILVLCKGRKACPQYILLLCKG